MERFNISITCYPLLQSPSSTREVIEVAEKHEVISVVLALAFSATLVTTGIFIAHSAHILRNDRSSIRLQRVFIMSLYPIFAQSGAFSLIVPLGASCALFVTYMYFSVVLFIFAKLLTGRYGKNGRLLDKIMGRTIVIWPKRLFWACQNKHRQISPLTGPNFLIANRVTLGIAAFILPVSAALEWVAVSYFENKINVGALFLAMEFMKYPSSFLAIQCTMTFYLFGRYIFKAARVRPELYTVILFLTLCGLQDPTILIMHYFTSKKCQSFSLSFPSILYIRSFVVTIEMFLAMFVISVWSCWKELQERNRKTSYDSFSECFYRTDVSQNDEEVPMGLSRI